MEGRNIPLEIAQLVGQPINLQLPVPYELAAIADTFTAEPGEKFWRCSTMEATSDVILTIDADGKITTVKRSPIADAQLTFSGLNSKLEYVLVDDVLNSVDTNILARRKESITRGMDKTELKMLLDAILAKTGSYLPGVNPFEQTVVTADDLFDVIMGMKHQVEDYGDTFVLLCGSTVKEKIDTYDKDNVATFNYKVGLSEKLRELGIEVVKVFGQVSNASNESAVALMNANKMILVAKNSRIAEGKPVKFVRRKISPDIAKLMGCEVDKAQRALVVNPTPIPIDFSGTTYNTLAYGIYGYESIVMTIVNPKSICIADATIIL